MQIDIQTIEGEPRAGTYLIAKGFNRKHKILLELINKYESDFKDFGSFKRHKLKSTGGRAVNEIMLNEDQAIFLGTLLRNNKEVVSFKKLLVQKFKACREELQELQGNLQAKSNSYQVIRLAGKLIRRETTDTMKEFIGYATTQGSKNANMYYMNITKMMNGLLFIVEGKYQNLREVMTTQQLMTVSSAEQIIINGLKMGMSRKKFYKDIYQDVKKRVMTFAELHGKTEIIETCLAFKNKDMIE